MTDDWDFYALRVDDQPASIYVDLGIRARAPLASLPNMSYVRLCMNEPRPDGLSSQEEFDTLIEIEDVLERSLCGDEAGYVGRNTSGGCRDFYFYTSSGDDWQQRVDDVLSAFQDYRYETGTREDAGWSTYLNFLLPGEKDRERIRNRRVCEELERRGDKLTVGREIDHWSCFRSAEAVDAYIVEAATDGFRLRNGSIHDAGPFRFGARIWRIDIPSYDNIDEVTLPLFEATLRYGGRYDGWECPVQPS